MKLPLILYGTAWKEQQTQRLTSLALNAGFRGIDTANQRKHYFEEAVGQAISDFLTTTDKARTELFLQTKFTYIRGQDHRLPYDKNTSLSQQLEQSFASSLQHLQTDFIDSYVLHGPFNHLKLSDEDLEVWSAMEKLVDQNLVKFLGVSNFSFSQLESLLQRARIKPKFLQNRCYAITGWDQDIRNLCDKHKVIYQGFSLLTANADYLSAPQIIELSKNKGCSLAQLIFAFSLHKKMLPLTGTTNLEHMKADLESYKISLSGDEIQLIEEISF